MSSYSGQTCRLQTAGVSATNANIDHLVICLQPPYACVMRHAIIPIDVVWLLWHQHQYDWLHLFIFCQCSILHMHHKGYCVQLRQSWQHRSKLVKVWLMDGQMLWYGDLQVDQLPYHSTAQQHWLNSAHPASRLAWRTALSPSAYFNYFCMALYRKRHQENALALWLSWPKKLDYLSTYVPPFCLKITVFALSCPYAWTCGV